MKVTIDAAGRIVLPKPLRDRLGLKGGEELEIEQAGDEVTIKPASLAAPMRRVEGLWVFRSGRPLSERTVRATLESTRAERERTADP